MTSPLEVKVDPAPVQITNVPGNVPPDVLVLPVAGPQGPPGAAGAGFVHTQTDPSSNWIITHNLGLYPAVSIRVADEQVIADVDYGSLNTITITFASPQTGSARLV
jgi:hypothetical protein